MENLITKENLEIKNMIHVIRGQQVMLDSDLAKLYGYEVKNLNRQVKRNMERFPEDFMFQLNNNEVSNLRCQIGTSSSDNKYGGRRYNPFVFTEQGIYMLATVLKSDIAVQQSIAIMRTFKEMKNFLSNNSMMLEKINNIEIEHNTLKKEVNEKFKQVFNYISNHEESNQKIFFDGQIFDAFSILVELVQKANKKIVLIDNYVDINTLNILAKKNDKVSVFIYTYPRNSLTNKDIHNFNEQYPHLELRYTKDFHDRFLVIDDELIYHIGASLKDAGKKCFGINKISNKEIINQFIVKLYEYIKLDGDDNYL